MSLEKHYSRIVQDLGAPNDITNEIINMHEIYKHEVTERINSYSFDFEYFAQRYYDTDYTEVANGQIGDLATVRRFMDTLAATVRVGHAVLTPVRATYPMCRLMGSKVAEVVALGDTSIKFPDGRSSFVSVTSTNILIKRNGRWLFHHLHRTFKTVAADREPSAATALGDPS